MTLTEENATEFELFRNQNGTRLPPPCSPASGRLASDACALLPLGSRPSCSATNKKPAISDRFSVCAQNGTRTHTPLRELGPEPSASTNSAIWALQKMQQGKYRPKAAMMSIGLGQNEAIVYLSYKNLLSTRAKVLLFSYEQNTINKPTVRAQAQ